jgi:hypothetical protein
METPNENMTAAAMVDATTPNPGVWGAVENVASAAVAAVEKIPAEVVALVEIIPSDVHSAFESLTVKIEKFFGSTNSVHLQDALLEMAAQIDAQGKQIAQLRSFLLNK